MAVGFLLYLNLVSGVLMLRQSMLRHLMTQIILVRLQIDQFGGFGPSLKADSSMLSANIHDMNCNLHAFWARRCYLGCRVVDGLIHFSMVFSQQVAEF